jgi:hypothetical protein
VVIARLDGAIKERFLSETYGNPLALLELPRALTPAEAATGIIGQSDGSLSSRIEDSFKRRLEPLPEDTRRLLVLAAAEPLGDPLLLIRAAAQLGLGVDAADPAEEAGLLEVRERWSFRHPLVRSAVYQSATQRERRLAHGALAEATDAQSEPDRRAWHRAQATSAPDEDVAGDLERTAERAKSRGGLSAAGAFLERAAILTPDPAKRSERALAAAEVMYKAGAFDAVQSLLRAVESAQLDDFQTAWAERLRAELSLSLGRDERAAVLSLLAAAERLGRLDPALGQEAHLEALTTAFSFANPEVLEAVADALGESPVSESGGAPELLVRGWAKLLQQGYPAGTDLLREAMIALRDKPQLEESELLMVYFSEGIARSTWDLDSWVIVTRRSVELARGSGALSILPRALGSWADANVATGDFAAAAAALAEGRRDRRGDACRS